MDVMVRPEPRATEREPGVVTIRPAAIEDWLACGRICYEAFATIAIRHGFPPDFPTVDAAAEPIRNLILHPGFHGVVAEAHGRIVGSSFLDERSMISAIGPVTVDPGIQDLGVGRALMGAMLDRVAERGAPGVRLVQIAYHNRSLSLYAKLGFDVKATLAAMYGPQVGIHLRGYAVRRATEDDLEACSALCVRVHGFAREVELREAIETRMAQVVERLGRITGYTTGVQYWSHSVAETNDDLKALIGAGRDYGSPGFLVPLSNGELFRWCLGQGLRVFFVTNLMSLGCYQEPQGAWFPSVGY
jgi:GNAT superfamily N-acetyltransferase